MAEIKEMKPGITEQKKQAVIEQLWLTYYNDTLLQRDDYGRSAQSDALDD